MRKKIESFSEKITHWIGSIQSIVFHTILFAVVFALHFLGVSSSDILLALTTLVSLEAIYLAIFIQMTINKQSEDIDEIQEDIEEDEEDEDVMLEKIENTLGKLIEEVVELKKHQNGK